RECPAGPGPGRQAGAAPQARDRADHGRGQARGPDLRARGAAPLPAHRRRGREAWDLDPRHPLCAVGAMPLQAPLIERWEAATGGLLVEGYGLTETSPVIVGNPMTQARRPGAIGVPFPDVEVRVADPEDLSRDVELGER